MGDSCSRIPYTGSMERRVFLHSAGKVGLAATAASMFGVGDAIGRTGESNLEDALRDDDLIYVSTRRKSGQWSSQAPIWFWFDDGMIYFTCSPDSWKARRLKEGGPVRIRVGTDDGPEIVGEAVRVHDLELVDRLGDAWNEKYWIAWLGFFRPRRERIADGRTFSYQLKLADASRG